MVQPQHTHLLHMVVLVPMVVAMARQLQAGTEAVHQHMVVVLTEHMVQLATSEPHCSRLAEVCILLYELLTFALDVIF